MVMLIPVRFKATLLLLAGFFAATVVSSSAPLAHVRNGTYAGYHLPSFNQDAFVGIPYVQPPVGELRFERSQSLNQSWEGVRNATDYKNSCYWANGNNSYGDNLGLPVSEDCLTMNIVRPNLESKEKLPVLVWIPGGGFLWGAAQRDVYNLSYPVNQSVEGGTPVVGVSFNYRINGFGFLASKEVKAKGSLNNGLADQRHAIRWIKENIEAFGGDPNKITIWGQSAGAKSVALQMTSYGGEGEKIFEQGILESGSPSSNTFHSMEENQHFYDSLAKHFSCAHANDSLACLKKVPARELLKYFNTSTIFGPIIDGDFIPDYPRNLVDQGRYHKVPVIIGTDMDEGTTFGFGNVNTTDELSDKMKKKFPHMEENTLKQLLEYYPDDPKKGSPYGTGDQFSNNSYGLQYKRGNAIGGDISIIGPKRRFALDMSKRGVDIYTYNWNQSEYGTDPAKGTTHFDEVVYVFANPNWNNQSKTPPLGPDPTGTKTRLMHLVSRFFMSFAATGDPNNAKIGFEHDKWPKHGENHQNYYFSSNGSHLEADDFRKEPIDFINYNCSTQFVAL